MRFDFITDAMNEVRFPRFFNCQPLTKMERRRLDGLPTLPPSYREFIDTFGRASFFRELDRDMYHLSVVPPSDNLPFCGDSYMLKVAATTSSMPVAFKLSEFANGGEPPIYEISLGTAGAGARRRADSFTEWLTKTWERSRRRYTKKAWARVLAGPEPFTEEEQRIVATRRGFTWRQLASEGGQIVVEFTNRSDRLLARYTIGVKDKYGQRMIGALYVDVAHIKPGTTSVVRVPLHGYKDLLTPEISVLFDKGDPMPETRGEYCEFAAVENGPA